MGERALGVAGAAVGGVTIVLARGRILETAAARRAQGDGLTFGQNVVGADVCRPSVDQDLTELARLAAVQAFGWIGKPFGHEDEADRRLALDGDLDLLAEAAAAAPGAAGAVAQALHADEQRRVALDQF